MCSVHPSLSGNCKWLVNCKFDSEHKSWHGFWDQASVGEDLEQAVEVERLWQQLAEPSKWLMVSLLDSSPCRAELNWFSVWCAPTLRLNRTSPNAALGFCLIMGVWWNLPFCSMLLVTADLHMHFCNDYQHWVAHSGWETSAVTSPVTMANNCYRAPGTEQAH